MPSFLSDTFLGSSLGNIDPGYASGFIDRLPSTNPRSSTDTTEKKGFWGTLGNIFGTVSKTVGTIFSNKNETGSLIDLSEIVKLPTVTVDTGDKTNNTLKWLAIGVGAFVLLSLFKSRRSRF